MLSVQRIEQSLPNEDTPMLSIFLANIVGGDVHSCPFHIFSVYLAVNAGGGLLDSSSNMFLNPSCKTSDIVKSLEEAR